MVIYNVCVCVCVCVCLCSLMWLLDEVMRTTDLHNTMQNMITDASWLTNNTAADCLICVLICTIQPVHLVMSA